MIKRSKNGIFKPKGSLALSIVSSDFSLSETEPKHFSEAIKHTAWQQAMADEYEYASCLESRFGFLRYPVV